MIQWQFYPKSMMIPDHLSYVVKVFEQQSSNIDSSKHKKESNEVLKKVSSGLQKIGYQVESGKKKIQKIHVPVLFGLNGKLEKSFEADAYHIGEKTVLEVEAGRGVTNNQFLKDLFQACVMFDVDYLGIAVRQQYRKNTDFQKVKAFFDALYASGRLKLPLKGVLIIGY